MKRQVGELLKWLRQLSCAGVIFAVANSVTRSRMVGSSDRFDSIVLQKFFHGAIIVF